MSAADPTGSATNAVARWQKSGQALAKIHRRELEQLTDAGALAAIEELLDLLHYLPPRNAPSGLLEQQRIFARLR